MAPGRDRWCAASGAEMWTAHGAWWRETAHGAVRRGAQFLYLSFDNKPFFRTSWVPAKSCLYYIGAVAAFGVHDVFL
eukprot:2480837-Pleurochrysis_carterae.AAC.1